jgi:hypothetical protein
MLGSYTEQPITKTAAGTIQIDLVSECGSLIIAAGGSATSFRLPPLTSSEQDARFTFFNIVDQNMVILPPSTAGYSGASLTLGAFNNLAAASVTFSTSSQKIGAIASARAIGGKWYVVTQGVATATIA